ncbi:AAA family ATPase [Salmonella enterica subsp. enterica serovar Newport]|nr:AAA family ATPase [Salmonella enterica subsp. enterica serovar Newport]EBI9418310.1 AAA family ATPase [Salmonella enterica]MLT78016.1 AAA family ATPase [Salmonella enterica subsp. enterica serovar Sandiego]EBH2957828.1 AAA family ATPase [Salmonella enterica subsp. enterica serovar Newport]EBQ5819524.1 AAA family ATPase [Salmonella enterica subsp. enterica serovar Newport]
MKNNIQFKNIKILSLRDRKAFSYEFSEGVNFIYGTNDVGKSSLIKSLYYTLGGDLRLDDAWKSDDIVTLVEINNGTNDFIFLRYKKIIGVFDLKNNDLVVYNSISSLASRISNIFGFKLELHNKFTGATTQANPACLFAPFFIDQDEGWKAVLNSFENMTMYSEWQKNILYYHSGIKPKEYYTVQGKIKEIKIKISELDGFVKILKRSKNKIDESFGVVLFDVDLDFYKLKLDRVLKEYSDLNLAQTEYRIKLLKLYSRKNFLESELKEITAVIDDDFEPLSSQNDNVASSVNEYNYINYRDEMLKNIAVLADEKSKIESSIPKLSQKLEESRSASEALQELILETQSEITLHDVIKSAAYHEIESTFVSQLDELFSEIGRKQGELAELQEELEVFNDKKRTSNINESFKEYFAKALTELGVENTKVGGLTSYNTITKGKTGSRGPRGIFAFHYALLSVMKKNPSIENMPIVIDSPKQQDLDSEHTHKLIKLCLDEFSTTNQIIIGTVGYESFMDGFHSIKLENKYHLLNDEHYDKVYAQLMPLFERVILSK